MKTKVGWLFIAVALCLVFAICCFSFMEKKPKKASIKINNRSICSEQVQVYCNYATLPMFEILTTFGVSVEWLTEDDVVISYGNVVIALSLSETELIDQQNRGLFAPLPGSTYYCCERVGSEVILDDNTMHNVLLELGIKTEIVIDYHAGEVYINELI